MLNVLNVHNHYASSTEHPSSAAPQMIGKLETTLAEKKTVLASFQARYKIKIKGEVRRWAEHH